MDTSDAPTRRGLASRSSSGSADSDYDECFQILWHYDCVLSPQSAYKLLNSPAQTSLDFSDFSPIRSPHSDLPIEDRHSPFGKGFPSTVSAHHLQPLFQMLDENNDGKVSLEDLMCVLRKLGHEVSRSCLISLMEPLDQSGDMAVNFAEFTALYQSIYSRELDTTKQEEGTQQTDVEVDSEELFDTFNVYDKNRDGYICAAELAEVLRDLGLPEGADLQKCQTLINRVDTDGNGLVDLREFKEMLCSGRGISVTPTPTRCASETRTQTSDAGNLLDETLCRSDPIVW